MPGAHEKTTGKEGATPTQLIKIAKARHLVGVTIFRCSTWPRPPQCRALATAKVCRKSEVTLYSLYQQEKRS